MGAGAGPCLAGLQRRRRLDRLAAGGSAIRAYVEILVALRQNQQQPLPNRHRTFALGTRKQRRSHPLKRRPLLLPHRTKLSIQRIYDKSVCQLSSGVNCSALTPPSTPATPSAMANRLGYQTSRAGRTTQSSPKFENIFDGTKLSVEGSRPKTTTGGINCSFRLNSTVQELHPVAPVDYLLFPPPTRISTTLLLTL